MNKKILSIGILLIVLSFFIAYTVSNTIFQIPEYYSTEIVIGPKMGSVSPFSFNTSNYFTIIYNSTEPINFYVFNESAYQELRALNTTNSSKIIGIKGVHEAILESYSGFFSTLTKLSPNNKSILVYNLGNLTNGTYYALLENTANETAYVRLYFTKGTVFENAADLYYSMPAGLFFLLGIALLFYGLIKKGKKEAQIKEEKQKRDKKQKSRIAK